MKIIDQTPLIDEKGNLGPIQRVQGMLQFGFNWPNELQVQNAIIKFFGSQLEKGYTLIRNMPLGESGIMIPIILLGSTGIYVIEITSLRGRYEAKGDAWNVESGNQYKPAPVNLIQRTARMARALQVYIERQGVKLPVSIEPVLIAGDPGLHIESVRPEIKVMMIDGIKSFVNGLATGKPVLRADLMLDYTERILHPRVKSAPVAPPDLEPEAESETPAAWGQNWREEPVMQQQPEPSRARAIFDASAEAQPFDPNGYDFALAEDDTAMQAMPRLKGEPSPAQPIRQAKPKQQKILGMTPVQLAIIAVLGVALLCVLAVLAYVLTTS
ncbi:MAG: nuclease-related domain-containing protein [Chloroflexota bacterium]